MPGRTKGKGAMLTSQKENIMKNHGILVLRTLALIGVGCLMIPTDVKAVGTADSADVTKLLADTKTVAAQLKADSAQMDSFVRSRLSWQSFAVKTDSIKRHINNAGQLLVKLKSSESTGSPWQRTTIKRIEPLLQEMADNLTATINHLNKNQNKVHFPDFAAYVKTNYSLATDLDALLRASVDYGSDKATLEHLSSE
jgi:hypothetical protein